MKKRISVFSAMLMLVSLFYFSNVNEVSARDCNGRQTWGDSPYSNPQCAMIGSGCSRTCKWYEIF